MPTENDDDDHDVISVEVSTETVSTGSTDSTHLPNPTDHIDRPVNVKPTASAESTTANLQPSSTSSPSTPSPTTSAKSAPSGTSTASENFLPHYFPTFGVSKRTQIWIYGALVIIVLFCAGLGTYLYIQRRKRIRNSRDRYEFEMLDDQEGGNNAGNTRSGAKGTRTRRRAGELYDAFAGESDEELLSDDEVVGGQYMDELDEPDEEESRGRQRESREGEKM